MRAQTTLMDVIAGRKTQGEIRGDILVNGFPKVQETWARVVGYVEQMDIHSPQVSCTQSEGRDPVSRAGASEGREGAVVVQGHASLVWQCRQYSWCSGCAESPSRALTRLLCGAGAGGRGAAALSAAATARIHSLQRGAGPLQCAPLVTHCTSPPGAC